MSEKNKSSIRIIAECAVLIAVGTVLAQIKLYRMPNGGSVTAASMVPFLMIGYRHGVRWGLIAGCANAVLQLLIGGLYPPVAPGVFSYTMEILLDYFLAYLSLALSGAFFYPFRRRIKGLRNEQNSSDDKNKKITRLTYIGLFISSLNCCICRFLCAFLSGFLVWDDVVGNGWVAVSYSFGYNLAYLLPESVITVAVTLILYKIAPRLFYKSAYYML